MDNEASAKRVIQNGQMLVRRMDAHTLEETKKLQGAYKQQTLARTKVQAMLQGEDPDGESENSASTCPKNPIRINTAETNYQKVDARSFCSLYFLVFSGTLLWMLLYCALVYDAFGVVEDLNHSNADLLSDPTFRDRIFKEFPQSRLHHLDSFSDSEDAHDPSIDKEERMLRRKMHPEKEIIESDELTEFEKNYLLEQMRIEHLKRQYQTPIELEQAGVTNAQDGEEEEEVPFPYISKLYHLHHRRNLTKDNTELFICLFANALITSLIDYYNYSTVLRKIDKNGSEDHSNGAAPVWIFKPTMPLDATLFTFFIGKLFCSAIIAVSPY